MATLPLFPLGTVLLPGAQLPLQIFEPRYVALLRDLLAGQDERSPVFGVVAIREGYEVGERGGQSVHRIGCLLQLTEVEQHDDGTFDIVAVGRSRLRLEGMDASGPFLSGTIDVIRESESEIDPALAEAARNTFEDYREALSVIHGHEVLEGSLPKDPTYLSWSLAATCLLTLPDRQSLLEAESSSIRLGMLITLLREELRAIAAIPSLPATELARTGWSPN